MTSKRQAFLISLIFLALSAFSQTLKEPAIFNFGNSITYETPEGYSMVRVCSNEENIMVLNFGKMKDFWANQDWELAVAAGEGKIEKLDKKTFKVITGDSQKKVEIDVKVRVNDSIYFAEPKEKSLEFLKSVYNSKGQIINGKVNWVRMSKYMGINEGDYCLVTKLIIGVSKCN